MHKFTTALVAALAITAATHARALDESHAGPQVDSLIGNVAYWSTWIKPQAAITEMDGEVAGIGGGSIGLALERAFYVGIGYYGLLGSVDLADGAATIDGFGLWYTGADIGYNFATESLVHWTASVLIGGGSAEAEFDGGNKDDGGIFVVEPQASLALNIATDVELGLGLGYRYVNGGPDGIDDSDLSGLTGALFFRWTETR